MIRTVTLATAGHIDHGKTALVRALTGIDTDRLPEEKKRGITIDLGFAHVDLAADLRLAIIDVPGHEAFIRNMAAGATGVDLGLLVIAADEGVMPQTREHLAILELLGVRPAAIALNKADLVDDDWLALLEEEVRDAVKRTRFASAPLVAVSAVQQTGLTELREVLEEAARTLAARQAGDVLRIPIDRAFTVRGTGTVVTGTVWSGSLEREQAVHVLPAAIPARVRGLQAQGATVERVRAGERAAIALGNVQHTALTRGDTITSLGEWQPTRALTAYVRMLDDSDWTLATRQRVHLHLGTATVLARVRCLGQANIASGEEGWVTLLLEQPVLTRAGDRFILRSYSPVTTIGGGTVIEWAAERYRRRSSDLTALEELRTGNAVTRARAAARLAGVNGIDARLFELHVEDGDANTLTLAAGRLYAPELIEPAAEQLLAALTALHAKHPFRSAIEPARLFAELHTRLPAALLQRALEQLIAEGHAESRPGGVAAARWVAAATAETAGALNAARDRFAQAGITPLSLEEVGSGGPDLVRYLIQAGEVVQIGTDLFLGQTALAEAIIKVRQENRGLPLSPADFRDLLRLSRRHLIPLLEYFDRTGVTRREGDLRTLPQDQAVPNP